MSQRTPSWSTGHVAARRTLASIGPAICALLLLAACSNGLSWPAMVTQYSAHYTLTADGSMRVNLDFNYKPPSSGGHGPLLRIPVQVATDNPKTDRLYPLSRVTASSPSGAPTGVRTVSKHGVTTVYIGDPKQKITRTQTYHVSYT